jgi:hypothetical protein
MPDLSSQSAVTTEVSEEVTPEDLGAPIYPDCEILESQKSTSITTEGRKRGFAAIALLSDEDPEVLLDFYRSQLPDHTVSEAAEDSAFTFSPPDGQRGAIVVLQTNEGQTCIVINRVFEE